jgi:hypothetical protein
MGQPCKDRGMSHCRLFNYFCPAWNRKTQAKVTELRPDVWVPCFRIRRQVREEGPRFLQISYEMEWWLLTLDRSKFERCTPWPNPKYHAGFDSTDCVNQGNHLAQRYSNIFPRVQYYYPNTKHVGVPLGIEDINNSVYFPDTGLPGCPFA